MAVSKKRKSRKPQKQKKRATSRAKPHPAAAAPLPMARKAEPTLGKDLAYAGLLIVVLMFFILPALYYYNYMGLNEYSDLGTVDLSLLFPFAAFSWMYFKGFDTRSIIESFGLSKRSFSLTVVLVGITLFIVIFLLELFVGVIGNITGVQINTNAVNLLAGEPLWFLVFVSFIGPIDEEIFFRGFLVKGIANSISQLSGSNLDFYTNNFAAWIGIIMSALIFGVLHASYNSTFGIEMIAAFIFGVLAGYVFRKTKSLYPSIVAHILINTLTASAVTLMLIH